MTEGPSLVMGVDFGTTFSGYVHTLTLLFDQCHRIINLKNRVAWALEGSESLEDVEVLSTWPRGSSSKACCVMFMHRWLIINRDFGQSPFCYLLR